MASAGPKTQECLERKRRLYAQATGVTPARVILATASIHSRRVQALRDAAFVRQILSQGISHPAMVVRKRFYTVGLDILGPDFIRPALKDRSKKVRRWAEKKLGK